MGLTAASVPKLSTDAASAMAPALTEPVTQSDISGQSPRPGDSITSSNILTTTETATENLPNNILNNGKYPKLVNGKQHEPIKNSINKLTDDQHTTNGVEHMDQKTSSIKDVTQAPAAGENNEVTIITSEQQQEHQSQGIKQPDSQTSTSSMGFTNLCKESSEVEQMLGDLAASGDIDLLSVFKTLESAPVSDANFDLASGLSLFNDVDVMNDYEETVPTTSPVKDPQTSELKAEIEKRRAQMQRKCDFLLRRLRKLQTRYMAQHSSEEIVGLIEHCQRYNRRKEREIALGMKPIQPESNLPDVLPYQPPPGTSSNTCDTKMMPVSGSAMRNIIKRLESTAKNQRSTLSKRQLGVKYFQSAQEATPFSSQPGRLTQSAFSCVHRFEDKVIDQVDQVSGLLHAELRAVERAVDSDATASSSGGESADEMILYSNPTQQALHITKRAAWRWARDRSSIASRWTWLLAQISDLEYRIRQHNELYQQIKKTKGAVKLDGEIELETEVEQSVNGYRGVLPGGSKPVENEADSGNGTSCRTRPFNRSSFRKRKLLQTSNLHTISKKAAKSSSVKCGCHWPLHPCALCTGRSDPTAPRDLPDTMPLSERIALLDFGFHPVLSFPDDSTYAVHFEAIMRAPEWQNKAIKYSTKQAVKAAEKAASGGTQSKPYGEERQKRSMKKMFGDRGKYKKKFGLLPGKYKKNKQKGQNNNRVKFSQLFKNSKFKPRKTSQSKSVDGFKTNNLHSNKPRLASISNDMESGGSGNNSCRSKNASPTPGVDKRVERSSDVRRSRNSYDIDNIVIPYSVAAQTQIEVLPYKEIPTPKWRIVEDDEEEQPTTSQALKPEVEEEPSDEIVLQMHERALLEERKKFTSVLKYPYSSRSRANRRTDSHAESSGTNTPINPTSPGPAGESGPPTPATPLEVHDPSDTSVINALNQTVNALSEKRERRRTTSMKQKDQQPSAVNTRSNTPEIKETIPPYEPRVFPLPDHVFEQMLAEMPTGHENLFENIELPDNLVKDSFHSSSSLNTKSHKTRRSKNNNSISYQEENSIIEETIDDDDSDRNSIVERLLLLEKVYDQEKLNNQDNSAAETESVDTLDVPDDDDDPNDPEWFEPSMRF